jgi:tetratricopeptide (TPR) repeat protein
LNPRLISARDLQSRLLADSGKFDEAAAAAQPACYGDDLPLELRGRAAWVEAQRGNVRAAIELMEQAVREAPEYWFGIEQLADWYERTGRWDDYARISERMVEMAPHYSVSYGYRGYSRMKSGNREAAKVDLRRAVQYDPSYVFAAFSLFDLLLDENELEEAAHTLEIVKSHAASEFVTAREVQLACRQHQRHKATDLLSALCHNTDAAPWSVRTAVEAVRGAIGSEATEAELRQCLLEKQANSEVAAALVELLAKRGRWRQCRKVLKQMAEQDKSWNRAALTYLHELKTCGLVTQVRQFIQRNWRKLQVETWVWGEVVEILSDLEMNRLLLKWCRDWRSRRDLRPRMLFFYAIALRYRNRDAEALAVHRVAATLPPDETFPAHRLWLLIEEIFDYGIPADFASRHAEIESPHLAGFYCSVLAMLAKLADVSTLEGCAIRYSEAKKQVFSSASGEVSTSMKIHLPFRRLKHRMCAKLAADRNKSKTAAWHRLAARFVLYLPRLA